ncbi:MAG: ATP-binding protein [Desulfohalobiaceae bacterium]
MRAMLAWLNRWLDRLKLRHKFALAILANITLVLVVFVFLVHSYQKQNLLQSQKQKNESLVHNMASEAVDPLLVNNYLQLDAVVGSAQEAVSACQAYILDSSGRVLAHTDKSYLGQQMPLPASETDSSGSSRDLADDGLQFYVQPISVQGSLLGHAVLRVDKAREAQMVARDLRGLHNTLALVSGVLFLVGVISSSYLSGLLTKRLSRLKENMQKVQQGNLDVQIPGENQVPESEVRQVRFRDCPSQDGCLALEHGFQNMPQQCLHCRVYELACGDEVGELILAFNNMVYDLRSNMEKLKQANLEKSRLERLSLMGQMSAQVAHEVKNPLNAILGSARYLQLNFQGQLLQEFLQVIQEESERLSDIVSEFLNFSKPGQLNKSVSDLNMMIKDTQQLVASDVQDSQVQLEVELSSNLQPFAFDYPKLKQAMLNLLLNAIQACGLGDRILVRSWQDSGWAGILVQDTGPGIAEEEQEQIFKPFYTTKVRGTGLGLAIVEQCVRDHQGEIRLQSVPGQGTNFEILIPADLV